MVAVESSRCGAATNPATRVVYISLVILFVINWLNFVDRVTLIGVLPDLKNGTQNGFDKDLSDTEVALLQTGFIISYTFFCPMFGYLGDRYVRKRIMVTGVILWSLFTAAGSFAPNYWFLLAMRSMVGAGEASYVTVAPAIVADLFSVQSRIRALSIFYIAVPIGTAMGYGIGPGAAKIANDTISKNYTAAHDMAKPWRFSLRVTPVLGILVALLILCILKEPPRGQSEGVDVRGISGLHAYYDDIKYCIKIPSYVLTTLGAAMTTFTLGGLAQWVLLFIYKTSCDTGHSYTNTETDVVFGVVLVTGGLSGILASSEVAKRLRSKVGASADCYVCAFGLYVGSPLVYTALTVASYSLPAAFVLTGFSVFCLSLCWAPVTAIILNITIPERRSTAAGFQVFTSHILGDAFSPLLIGVVSDAIHGNDKSDHAESLLLQEALYITCFAAAIGSICFLAATFYIHHDEHQVKLYIHHHDNKPKEDGGGHENSNKEQSILSSYSNSEQSIDHNYSVNYDHDDQ